MNTNNECVQIKTVKAMGDCYYLFRFLVSGVVYYSSNKKLDALLSDSVPIQSHIHNNFQQ